jgi:peptidoglycan/LPS O-acetylase OafA/YrhL
MSGQTRLAILEDLPEGPNRRLRSVDGLRGLAALAVLLVHIPHLQTGRLGGSRLLFLPIEFGMRGVILFLVLSGFCIHLHVAKDLARGPGARCNWAVFWRRRFYRLYPPYLAAIVFSMLILLALYGSSAYATCYLDNKKALVWDLVTHLCMIHNLFKPYALGLGNGPFWTLGLEEQLYALYAVFLLLRYRLSAVATFRVTLAATLVWYGGAAVITWLSNRPGESWPSYSWTLWPVSLWFVWTLGAVAAEAYAGVPWPGRVSLPSGFFSPARRSVAGTLAGTTSRDP